MAKIDDLIARHAKRLGADGDLVVAEVEGRTKLAADFARARLDRGMTQRELAAASGIDQAEISRLETATSNPTLSTLDALGAALDCKLALIR